MTDEPLTSLEVALEDIEELFLKYQDWKRETTDPNTGWTTYHAPVLTLEEAFGFINQILLELNDTYEALAKQARQIEVLKSSLVKTVEGVQHTINAVKAAGKMIKEDKNSIDNLEERISKLEGWNTPLA